MFQQSKGKEKKTERKDNLEDQQDSGRGRQPKWLYGRNKGSRVQPRVLFLHPCCERSWSRHLMPSEPPPPEFNLDLPISWGSRWSHHADSPRMRLWRCQSWHTPRWAAKFTHRITAYQGRKMSSFALLWIGNAGTKPHPGNHAFCGEFGWRTVASKKKQMEVKWHCSRQETKCIAKGSRDFSRAPHRNHPEMSAGILTPEQAWRWV